MSDNNITVVGNITRAPELTFTTGGQAKAEFGLAVNRSWTDRQTNERKEQTSFFNVVAWGQLGQNAAECFDKGNRAVVTGRLEQRSYEKDGQKRERVEIVADDIGASVRFDPVAVLKAERKGGDY